MKKILILLACVAMLCSLLACSDSSGNPFLECDEKTTKEEIEDLYGTSYSGSGQKIRYDEFELFDAEGEMGFRFREVDGRDVIDRMSFSLRYPGYDEWSPEDQYDEYYPSRSEKQDAQEFLDKAIEAFTKKYGEPTQPDDNEYLWWISDGIIKQYLMIETDDSGKTAVFIYCDLDK